MEKLQLMDQETDQGPFNYKEDTKAEPIYRRFLSLGPKEKTEKIFPNSPGFTKRS